MPRGESGRIVVEIPTEQKRRLYAVLDEEGLTLREWFLEQLEAYISDSHQPSLFSAEDEGPDKP